MTVQSRTALKTYFISGATPTESNFSDLIDSALMVGDIVDSFNSSSTVLPLSASAGKLLNDSLASIDARVGLLEDAENQFGEGYYNKTDIDSKLSDVDAAIAGLPYNTLINELNSDIASIIGTLAGKADSSHTQEISTINGLEDALILKADVAALNFVRDTLTDSINAIVPGTNSSSEIATLQSSIDGINATIGTLATKIELDAKASDDHLHTVTELEGIEDFYTKSQVDTLILSAGIGTHSHVAADISDLGTEIQSKTTLLMSDHTNLTDNPHSVTKEQVGLGNVSNLSPADMVSTAGVALSTELNAVNLDLATHKGQANNPHFVTKEQVGLGNVTNVNVEQLLTDHLNAANPHNIDLNFFDVYTTAETDSRMQAHIDSVRYAFTPPTNDDSAGDVADIAYDADNIYIKTPSGAWAKSPLYPVWSDRGATQDDVNAGNATQVGEIISVNEPPAPAVSSEVFGFQRDSDGNLIITTTNGGTEDIDFATYNAFQDVIYGNTDFDFEIIEGNLVLTI